mmetsp:Transcript_8397/g.20873  ORF Transcript_8397/g.20873 Transcript_8397/m.20873 type:complete len:284 (-) Transcript_8397:57-908(-)
MVAQRGLEESVVRVGEHRGDRDDHHLRVAHESAQSDLASAVVALLVDAEHLRGHVQVDDGGGGQQERAEHEEGHREAAHGEEPAAERGADHVAEARRDLGDPQIEGDVLRVEVGDDRVRRRLLHRAAHALQQAHDEAVATEERAIRHRRRSGEEDGREGDEHDTRDVHPHLAVVRHPAAGHGRAQEDDRGEAREDDPDRVLAQALLVRLLREEGCEHRVDGVAAQVGQVDAEEDEHLVVAHAQLAHGRSTPARRRRRPAILCEPCSAERLVVLVAASSLVQAR